MKDTQEEARRSAAAQPAAPHKWAVAAPGSGPAPAPAALPLYPFVDEARTPLPRCWSAKDKYHLLSLTHQDLRVHYKGEAVVGHTRHKTRHTTGQGKSHKDAAAVRATQPVPAACGLFYFELRVVSKGRDGLFGVGLSQAGVSLNRLPGWDKFSFGYHGDDGHSFSFSGSGVPYGPQFSTGDVVGCGLNLLDATCFYTKNGHCVGTAFTDLPVRCLLVSSPA